MHGLNNAQLPLTVGILVFDQVEALLSEVARSVIHMPLKEFVISIVGWIWRLGCDGIWQSVVSWSQIVL
jgi:hypothetical protein